MIYAPAGLLPGILFPSSEKGSPSPAGIHFRSRRGSYPHRTDSDHRRLRARDSLRTRQWCRQSITRSAGAPRICLLPQHDAYLQPTAKSGRRRARVSTAVETTWKIFLASEVGRAEPAGRRLRQAPPPRRRRTRREALLKLGKPEKDAECREKIKAQAPAVPKTRCRRDRIAC
jgi:hypothetical protein